MRKTIIFVLSLFILALGNEWADTVIATYDEFEQSWTYGSGPWTCSKINDPTGYECSIILMLKECNGEREYVIYFIRRGSDFIGYGAYTELSISYAGQLWKFTCLNRPPNFDNMTETFSFKIPISTWKEIRATQKSEDYVKFRLAGAVSVGDWKIEANLLDIMTAVKEAAD